MRAGFTSTTRSEPSSWRSRSSRSRRIAATEGMDAIVNMTVMRRDPVEAFRVNTIGAYNVMRAAVARGMRRVVHTGPEQVSDTMQGAYWPDFGIPSDAPSRPGTQLYFVS